MKKALAILGVIATLATIFIIPINAATTGQTVTKTYDVNTWQPYDPSLWGKFVWQATDVKIYGWDRNNEYHEVTHQTMLCLTTNNADRTGTNLYFVEANGYNQGQVSFYYYPNYLQFLVNGQWIQTTALTIEYNTANIISYNKDMCAALGFETNHMWDYSETEYDTHYNDGISEGITQGWEQAQEWLDSEQARIRAEGYEEGYNARAANSNILKTADWYLALMLSNQAPEQYQNQYQYISFKPEFYFGAVTFKPAIDALAEWSKTNLGDEEAVREYIDYCYIQMNWSGNLQFEYSTMPLFISGNQLVDSGTLTTNTGVSYQITSERTENAKTKFEFANPNIVTYPVMVKQILIQVGNPGDLLNEISLFAETEGYAAGYSEGYTAAEQITSSQAYTDGKNEGYKLGYNTGKAEGIQISNNGDWTHLFSAVIQAPVNAFQSLFNFNILGLDMRVAIGTILTICVVLIIIKKVVL